MNRVGRFINRLSVRLIVFIVLSVTLLGVLAGIIIYHAFTQTMLKEHAEFADQIAEYHETHLDPGDRRRCAG